MPRLARPLLIDLLSLTLRRDDRRGKLTCHYQHIDMGWKCLIPPKQWNRGSDEGKF